METEADGERPADLRLNQSLHQLIVTFMHTHNLPFISILSTFALVLPLTLALTACDGIDDQDARDGQENIAEDEAVDDLAQAEDDAEDDAKAPLDDEFEITDDVTPSATCSGGYAQAGAPVILYDQWGTALGDVRLTIGNNGCLEATSRTNVTDFYVKYYSRRIVTKLQKRTGLGGWTDAATIDTGWTSNAVIFSASPAYVTFPVGTLVRACGLIEGGIQSGTTQLGCTEAALLQ